METYYIYKGHMGGFYWSLEDLEAPINHDDSDYEDDSYEEYYYDDYGPLGCDQCGDSDYLIGTMESVGEPTQAVMEEFYRKEELEYSSEDE